MHEIFLVQASIDFFYLDAYKDKAGNGLWYFSYVWFNENNMLIHVIQLQHIVISRKSILFHDYFNLIEI